MNLNLDAVAGTLSTSSGQALTPETESFVTTFFTNIKITIGIWLADATNGVTDVFANVFNAKEKICVDGECLTKDDIHNLLLLAHPAGTTTTTPPPASEPAPAPADPIPASAVEFPVATCSDGIQNQDETGIDIGGVCAPVPFSVEPAP